MKQLLVRVMLVCITTATSVFADSLDAALGANRSSLSAEQISARSERLEESTSFSLLRFPEALRAPGTHFRPADLAPHRSRRARLRPGPDDSRRHDLRRELRRSAGEKPDRSGRHRAVDERIGQRARPFDREEESASARKPSRRRDGWERARTGARWCRRFSSRSTRRSTSATCRSARSWRWRAALSNRRSWLGGRVDFAIAEYHMGAGRMAGLLSAYFGRTLRVSDVPAEMRGTDLSYPELYWTNTPYYRRRCTRRSTISIASTTRQRTTSACGRRCACSRPTASRPKHTPRWRRPIKAVSAGRCCRAGSGASSASRSVVRCLPRRRRMPASVSCCCRTSHRCSASAPSRARCRPSDRRSAPPSSSHIISSGFRASAIRASRSRACSPRLRRLRRLRRGRRSD